MRNARQSLTVWAIYVYVLGAALLVIPNVILGLFGIAETDEVWIRVVGMLVIIFGILYSGALREETREMYLASVIARTFAAIVLVALAFTVGPWQLVLFAALDAAGAAWTGLALRADERAGIPAAA